MTDLPEKIYQDGSTGQYRVTCEYCDKDFLGHKMDTTCTQCGEGYLDTVLENMSRAMTMKWLAKRLRKSIGDEQDKLYDPSPDTVLSWESKGGSMSYINLGGDVCYVKGGELLDVTREHTLKFRPSTIAPVQSSCEEYLLYNKCDGYHLAFANFDDSGEFDGFSDFMRETWYTVDFYEGWALLPLQEEL